MKFNTYCTVIFLISIFFSNNLLAKKCQKEDFVNFVSDVVGCIAINIHSDIKYDEDFKKKKLVIFIHGDQVETKNIYFDTFASEFVHPDILLISITRPGWTNIKDHKSEGKLNISNGDNYIPKEDVDPIYRVIKKLKKKFKTLETLVVGHSGGAAITGILYGRFTKLVDSAILISCPCIVPLWRRDYYKNIIKKTNKLFCMPKFKSHSPHQYVKKISSNLKIHIFAGNQDKNTLPIYSEEYQILLKQNNKNSKLYFFENDHLNILKNEKVTKKISEIINS
jgi:hypothetical protein